MMFPKFIPLVLIVFASCSRPGECSEQVTNPHYQAASKYIQLAWKTLEKSESTIDSKTQLKQNLRYSLAEFYRAKNKTGQVNFLLYSSDQQLSEAIAQIHNGEREDFPVDNAKYAYRVTKQKSGTLNFTPTLGCTGAFSVTKGSSVYDDASKHVGAIENGQVKSVTEIPFKKPDTVLILDPPN